MAEGCREWVVASVLAIAMLWKLTCVWLRTRRAKLIASFSPVEDAHVVHEFSNSVEFPFLFNLSMQLALLRSYGVPSISRILAKEFRNPLLALEALTRDTVSMLCIMFLKTGNFAKNAAKRADDTEILLREGTSHHIDSDRGAAAIRRVNYIHSLYPSIKNEEYLYVLALFIVQPVRWISQYGYREMTTSECVANFVVWRDYGVRMGIKDIPEGYEELEDWLLKYEAEHLAFSPTNRVIADSTGDLLIGSVPKPLQPYIQRLIFAMLDEPLLVAFGFPKQPPWLQSLAKGLLKFLNGTLVAMLLPPRPLSWSVNRISVDANENGAAFDMHKPRQFRPDYFNSYPEGYKIAEVGPGKPGALGEACPGELLCPISERYFQKSSSSPSAARNRKT